MAKYRMANGVRVQLTPEEEAAKLAGYKEFNDAALTRALAALRLKRNRLLAETDFYAGSDVTLSEAMTTYRQELRDLPSGLSTVEDVENVTYPVKP